ncbi:MAG: EAL domain-containing protein [Vicinamibacterales bacterium]
MSSLDDLRSRGITLTLDDFGTGYSALSRLERLPIDAMKIDKSFLEGAGGGDNGVIAKAIIAMGHALGMTIVGEGVENEAQWEFLKREGCDFAQGYLLGRPVPASALADRLRRPAAEPRS